MLARVRVTGRSDLFYPENEEVKEALHACLCVTLKQILDVRKGPTQMGTFSVLLSAPLSSNL